MSEDFSTIDAALLRTSARPRRSMRPRVAAARVAVVDTLPEESEEVEARRSPWTWLISIEFFVAVQLLWGVCLFLPGAQGFRSVVRAAPYLLSLAMLALYALRDKGVSRPAASAGLMIGALAVLIGNLLHPTTAPAAGLAQCIFQLSIAAPLFWAHKSVRSPVHLMRVLHLLFFFNLASAALGLLQVYFPDRFLPPQFSLALDESWLSMMSYVGAGDRLITRPPGLSDVPGGASVAGGLTAVFGLGLSLRSRPTWQTAALVGASGVGLAVVYLTQARTMLLMTVGACAVIGILSLGRGKAGSAGRIVFFSALVIVGSFLWASALGGASVEDRFLNIQREGAIQTFQTNRGQFLQYTVGELLDRYPLGAGLGRWGMMNMYFGNQSDSRNPPLYAEIQLTGWLYDGGIPLWIFYGGAILVSILAGVKLTGSHEPVLAEAAAIGVALQAFILGTAMSGPTFNTQMGIMFWTITALLCGAAAHAPVDEGFRRRS